MAGRPCNIAGCNNIEGAIGIRFFPFPTKKVIRDAWIERCKRPGLWYPEQCVVCSDHFMDSDYKRNFRTNETMWRQQGKLRIGAIPSLLLEGHPSGHGVIESVVMDNITNIDMMKKQRSMDVDDEPKSDPLALNEEDFHTEQREDSNFTETKVDLEDLLDPSRSAFDKHQNSPEGDCDPLAISDVKLYNSPYIKDVEALEVNTSVHTTTPEDELRQVDTNCDVVLPEASGTNSQGSIQVGVSAPAGTCVVYDFLFRKPFSSLTPIEQKQIIVAGRPMPALNCLGRSSKRAAVLRAPLLPLEIYKKHFWITGSEVLKGLFCWPCILFGEGLNCEGSSVWNTKGFNITPLLSEEVIKHEKSEMHMRSFFKFTMFSRDHDAGAHSSRVYEEIRKNREILRRLIDATCILAEVEMPNCCFADNGQYVHKVYLDIIGGLSEYDLLLKTHIQTKNKCKFTTLEILNDLINSIQSVMLNKIKQEVEGSKFVSIICKEALEESDAMSGTLLSATVLRFVDKEGTVLERFIGYSPATESYEPILKVIKDFKLEDKLVSLSSVGQPNLLSCAEIYKKYACVVYAHHFSQNFNSVLKQKCSSIRHCKLFLSMLSSLAAFFSQSSKQRCQLELFLSTKFPKFTPTMLNFTSHLEETALEFLPQLLEFFKTIMDNPENWDYSTVVSAMGFRTFFQKVPNIFFLHLFAILLKHAALLSEVSEEVAFTDYKSCAAKVHIVERLILAESDNFEQLWEQIELKKVECDVSINPPHPKKISNQMGELNYKRVFREIIDNVYAHTADVFASIEKLKFFDLIDPKSFENGTPPPESLALVEKTFPDFFNIEQLRTQLIILYGIEELKGKFPHEYILYLRTLTNAKEFVEVYKLVCLYLTIPCTQVSTKPSFLALERVKCVREMLGQHPTSNLAVMTIENQLLSQLKEKPDFYADVTNEFAKRGRPEFSFVNEK